jgi:hypothetical protein
MMESCEYCLNPEQVEWSFHWGFVCQLCLSRKDAEERQRQIDQEAEGDCDCHY